MWLFPIADAHCLPCPFCVQVNTCANSGNSGSRQNHVRHVVGASPGRSIFDVVVTWHVLGQHGDLVGRVLG